MVKKYWSENYFYSTMPVDKSWMHLRIRNCLEYEADVKKFIEKVRLRINKEEKIYYPYV